MKQQQTTPYTLNNTYIDKQPLPSIYFTTGNQYNFCLDGKHTDGEMLFPGL